MKSIFSISTIVAAALALFFAAPPAARASRRGAEHRTEHRTEHRRAPQAASSTPSAKKKTSSRRRRHHSRREPTQKAPTADRISEIQSALARGGYYQGDPNGKWDSNTVDAMEKFQSSHGLTPSGKLDALSLQKLGLGSDIAGVSAPRPLPAGAAAPAAVPASVAPAAAPASATPAAAPNSADSAAASRSTSSTASAPPPSPASTALANAASPAPKSPHR